MIDAVLKQSEIKFALGRHAEHVQALEAHPRARRDFRRSCTPGGLALLDRVPPQPHRRPPRDSHRPLPEGRRDRREGGLPGTAGVRRVLPHARLRRVGRAQGSDRGGGACPRGLRSPSQRVVGVPDAVRPQHGGQRARRMVARPRVLSPGGRVRPGPRRSATQGGRALEKRLDSHPAWCHRCRACSCCEDALALSPIAFDAVMTKATHGYGLIKRGDVAEGVAQLEAGRGVVPAVEPPRTPTHSPRCGFSRGSCVVGRHPEARALLEDVLATARDRGYRHVEGMATRLLGGSPAWRMTRAAAARHFETRDRSARARRSQEPGGQGAGEAGGAPACRRGCVAAHRRCWSARSTLFETLGTLDAVDRVRASLDRQRSTG